MSSTDGRSRSTGLRGKSEGTVTRAFRISRGLDEAIQTEAKARGEKLSSFVAEQLSKYVEWESKAEKFGFVSMTKELFRSLLDLIKEDEMTKLAERLVPAGLSELVTFWYGELDIVAYLRFLELFFGHTKLAQISVNKNNENGYALVLQHEYGLSWSLHWQRALTVFMRKTFQISPASGITKNSVVLRFKA